MGEKNPRWRLDAKTEYTVTKEIRSLFFNNSFGEGRLSAKVSTRTMKNVECVA